MQHNVVNWFEIYVDDMTRARRFYEGVFQKEMTKLPMEGMEMVAFPWTEGAPNATGALVKSGMNGPSPNGSIVYF